MAKSVISRFLPSPAGLSIRHMSWRICGAWQVHLLSSFSSRRQAGVGLPSITALIAPAFACSSAPSRRPASCAARCCSSGLSSPNVRPAQSTGSVVITDFASFGAVLAVQLAGLRAAGPVRAVGDGHGAEQLQAGAGNLDHVAGGGDAPADRDGLGGPPQAEAVLVELAADRAQPAVLPGEQVRGQVAALAAGLVDLPPDDHAVVAVVALQVLAPVQLVGAPVGSRLGQEIGQAVGPDVPAVPAVLEQVVPAALGDQVAAAVAAAPARGLSGALRVDAGHVRVGPVDAVMPGGKLRGHR